MAKRYKPMRARTDLKDAVLVNNATYTDYLERFKKIAMSIFEWTDLPDSMDARYIEKCLYYLGAAGLLHTEEYGFINTKATSAGDFNIYGLPTAIQCYSYSFNEQRRLYSGLTGQDNDINSEAILVMNNWERIPTASTIELFALRLYEAERACDVNIKAQKTPVLLLIDENQRFTMKNLYEQYDGNTPVIFGDKNQLSMDSIKAIKTDAPFVANDIMQYKKEIWNEALTFLGVNNLSEKRERLISDETNTNNELINLNLMSYLAPRKLACKQFNEKYGLNIDVKVRSDLDNIIKRAASVVMDDYADKVIEQETLMEAGVEGEDE
ncbi:MAG: hypothetical protein IIZ78_26785 [Clostridiales bacterium]|nr:hypothetical protein [Clostridiales bacterium]